MVKFDSSGDVFRAAMSWDNCCQGELHGPELNHEPYSPATDVACQFIDIALAVEIAGQLSGCEHITPLRHLRVEPTTTVLLQPLLSVELDSLRIVDASFDWADCIREITRGSAPLEEGDYEYERAADVTVPFAKVADQALAEALAAHIQKASLNR